MTIAELKELAQKQASILIASGTGKVSIDDAEKEYQQTDVALRKGLRLVGLTTPFTWRSLWEWHGFYAQGEMPTYAARRLHIAQLKNGLFDELDTIEGVGQVHDPAGEDSEPTWEAINVRISGLIQVYSNARDKDSWQDVGRRAREILIDLGKLIADPVLVPEGKDEPKLADARAWFDLFLDQHASGGEHIELRQVMRKVWDLAQKVTHGDIGDIDAYAAAQATVMLVRTVQKLVGGSTQ